MTDFQIKRTGRICHGTQRELIPGEEFYSELVREDDEFLRRDYCDDAWRGPAETSIGWWRARVPQADGGRVYWAPREVLLAYFESLQGDTRQQPVAYVMALLLIRKRILQLVDSQRLEEGEVLEVRNARDDRTCHIPVIDLTPQQVAEIQQELAEQLFMDLPTES
jgi:hypothetical protein